MTIHKIELYLKGKKEAEFVGVVLDDVLAEADALIAHWLSTGYTEADYLAMVTSGGSYRYESPMDRRINEDVRRAKFPTAAELENFRNGAWRTMPGVLG